jgi:hypothetical protein
MKKSQRTAEDLRQATDEAISFMRSIVKLVERRGLREVDYEFAWTMFGMARKIIAPNDESRDARLDPGGEAYEFFEAFGRVPVTVFKGVVELVERELRKDLARVLETRSAAQRAA